MPRRKSSVADDLVLLPWWVSAALGFGALVAFGTVMPKPFQPLLPLVVIGLFGLSLVSALRSWSNSRMLDNQTSIDSLRALPWKRFEDLLAEVYRRQGYKVEETLGGGGDGGVDLVLGRDGCVTLVQCKRWSARQRVKVQTVRELFGLMHDRRATAAKLVATTSFTSEAKEFAKDKPIELVDGAEILHLIRSVQSSGKMTIPRSASEPDHLAPACPSCGKEMKLRTAKRGINPGEKFWGCSSYPKCHGTRSL